ncbi:hypothetical protein OGAPHI_007453 [Ogataea philodendri]|uniref:Protein kinase domain-containing protein n=1 Tax=Ogataea philodendri TaxID=1378263 RepID=A0A9P8NTU1_9ASCO|nr:uncharacterized protein OGAPHI_007453 [Ogataea philodendri]KAH3660248.1 hypothetical protein OGAPHI_007453 [Ogataea philodendri]
MPLFKKQGVPSESPRVQPSVMINRDDSDFSLYQTISNSSVADYSQGVPGRGRTSSMSHKLKNLFVSHDPPTHKPERTASVPHSRKASSPPMSTTSSTNSPSLEAVNEHKSLSNTDLVESLNRLKMMPPLAENDLDEAVESSERHARQSTPPIPNSASIGSSTSSVLSQPARVRSVKNIPKFIGSNLSEESLSPPLSRSNSANSRQRSSSISVANSESSFHHNYSALKQTQSGSYSQIHLQTQRENLVKLKNGRLKISPDGSMHEHDYTKYKTHISKNTKTWWGWTKKREPEDDEFVSIENSVSLLPDSYSIQLMELKSDPKNYRWNYDDSDEESGSDSDSDSDEDDDDFDDDADDELIEPIIGKDQLTLMNMMMDKMERPEKFKEKLKTVGSKKMSLSAKYGHIGGVVGRGSFGTVCISAVTDPSGKKNKALFAIKQLKKRTGESLHHFSNRVTSEFMISSSLTHQAVINVYDLMVDPTTMTYSQVMEFIPCGDLFALIAMTNGLEVTECDCFFKQILNAITYLHSVGISHNDLKVENLLLTRRGQLKIIDFGTSAVFKTAWEDKVQYSKGACGSERYVSPEQFVPEGTYDPRLADIWSLGIIYLVMLYGNYAWQAAKPVDEGYEHFLSTRAIYDYTARSRTAHKQFKIVRKGSYNQIESISSGHNASSRRYVLYNILNPDPKYRMRSYQIWQSDWVKGVRVCDAGRGLISQEEYYDMALKTWQEEQHLRKSPEEVLWELLHVVLQVTLGGQELHVSTIVLDLVVLSLGSVLSSVKRSETPLLRDDDLLLTWELVSGSSQTLNDNILVGVLGSDREQNLSDINTGSQTVWLTPGTSHTLLQSIGTGTRQHLVDSQNVVRVHSHSHVERISTRHLGDVLVCANSGSFQSLGGQLLQLVRNKVDTEWEVIDISLLSSKVKDSDLGVWDTSVVSRLWERLVLTVSVTSSWSSSHSERLV